MLLNVPALVLLGLVAQGPAPGVTETRAVIVEQGAPAFALPALMGPTAGSGQDRASTCADPAFASNPAQRQVAEAGSCVGYGRYCDEDDPCCPGLFCRFDGWGHWCHFTP